MDNQITKDIQAKILGEWENIDWLFPLSRKQAKIATKLTRFKFYWPRLPNFANSVNTLIKIYLVLKCNFIRLFIIS